MLVKFLPAYERLIDAVGAKVFEQDVDLVRHSLLRTYPGVMPSSSEDPWFEERSVALWDRVLVTFASSGRLTENHLADSGAKLLLRNMAIAQRGLFLISVSPLHVDLRCVDCGAAFRLADDDDLGKLAATRSTEESTLGGLVDGYVVPTVDGVMTLPGSLTHDPEATVESLTLLPNLAGQGLDFATRADLLLALRHRLLTRSRMRPRHVYRVDAALELVSAWRRERNRPD